MGKSTHILLVTLAVFCLQQEIKAASDPQKQETVLDIYLFADINDYLKANPGIKLKALENVNKVGHTLGVREAGDKVIFESEDTLYAASDYVPHNHPVRSENEVKMEITYVEFHFVDNVNGGKAFLSGGGIGQSFISLLIETPSKIEDFVRSEIVVYGREVQKQETVLDIYLFADINDYLKANPGIKLIALENVNEVGHTIGIRQEGDKVIFESEDTLYAASDYVPHNHPVRSENEVKMEITYVEFHFVDNVNGGKAFLTGGGIGQSFISLLIETPSKIEDFVRSEIVVYGRDVEKI